MEGQVTYNDLPKEIKDRFSATLERLMSEAEVPLLAAMDSELTKLLEQILVDAYKEGRAAGYFDGIEEGRSVGFSEGYSAAGG